MVFSPSYTPLLLQASYWACILGKCFSNFTVHRSPGDLVIMQILIEGAWGGARDVVFGKLPGDATAAGLWPTVELAGL